MAPRFIGLHEWQIRNKLEQAPPEERIEMAAELASQGFIHSDDVVQILKDLRDTSKRTAQKASDES